MSDRTTCLLRALALVKEAGSTLEPTWNSRAGDGVVYRGTGSPLDDHTLRSDLEALAAEHYLERVFIERLSLCPNCESHALNVHEACLTCSSSNLTPLKAILHFRCGFVGPAAAFAEEPRGRRCPKCRKLLNDLGTDHDSPGDYFACRACNATFQVPEVGARCLSCGARFTGSGMRKIGQRDIFGYRLTALGAEALSAGRLADESREALVDVDGLLYRRHVLIEQVEDERRRRSGLGTRFGLIVLGQAQKDGRHELDAADAPIIRKALIETDKLGRLDADHFVALLPGASSARTKSTLQQIVAFCATNGAVPLRVQVVDLPNGGSVADYLDEAARRIDAHE